MADKAKPNKRVGWGVVASLMSAAPIAILCVLWLAREGPAPLAVSVLSTLGAGFITAIWAIVPFFIWDALYNRRYD